MMNVSKGQKNKDKKVISQPRQGVILTLECLKPVQCNDCLDAGAFSAAYRIADSRFEEGLYTIMSFPVDEARCTLHAIISSETTNGRPNYSLETGTNDLAMELDAPLHTLLNHEKMYPEFGYDRLAACLDDCGRVYCGGSYRIWIWITLGTRAKWMFRT